MQPFVVGCPIVDVALVVDFQGTDEEGHRASLRLCQITLPKLFADFQELHRDWVFAHHEAPQVVAQAVNEMLGLKAFADDVVEDEQDVARVAVKDVVDDLEIIVVVKYVEVVDDVLVSDALAREAHHLVEDGEGVAQGAVGLLGDDVQGFGFGTDAFTLSHKGQMFGDVVNRDALEIEDLAT